MTELSDYEKMRLRNIAEREDEWNVLVAAKQEFDGRKKQISKKWKVKQTPPPVILRKSSRKKCEVNYREYYTAEGKCDQIYNFGVLKVIVSRNYDSDCVGSFPIKGILFSCSF